MNNYQVSGFERAKHFLKLTHSLSPTNGHPLDSTRFNSFHKYRLGGIYNCRCGHKEGGVRPSYRPEHFRKHSRIKRVGSIVDVRLDGHRSRLGIDPMRDSADGGAEGFSG